jgi:two-component sensor histidine kinase
MHQQANSSAIPPAQFILDCLPISFALLDRSGVIVAVNEDWCKFGCENGSPDIKGFVGTNYLAICDMTRGAERSEAEKAAAGIRAVLENQTPEFRLNYACHSPVEKRWFQLHVSALIHEGERFAAVAHQNITPLAIAEQMQERLFIEAQHRAKNNLQLISSFIQLRARKATTPETREALLELSCNIETIHLLHEKLYHTGKDGRLDLGSYLGELASALLSIQAGGASIRLRLDVESVFVDPSIAVPVGLILNEFMTNSMKYAFEGGDGIIGLELLNVGEEIQLRFWDNGRGLPEEMARHGGSQNGGTGIALANALARQINASAAWSSEGGTTLVLKLPNRPL